MPVPHKKSKSDPSRPAVNLWAFGFCKKIFCAPFELKFFEDDFFLSFEGNKGLRNKN